MLEESLKRPLLGAGGGCSPYIAGLAIADWHGVHNSFIQVFCETGSLGLCFYLLLFYLPFKQYRQSLRHHPEERDNHRTRFQFILLALISFGATASFLPQAYSPIHSFLSGLALVQYQLISIGASNHGVRNTQPRHDANQAAIHSEK